MDAKSSANGGSEAHEDGCPAEEEEGVVDIKEYVESLEAEELEVDMILGGDEGKECTYPGGYLSRQAVFSCITCCPDGNAGVCTACSLNCHDGHEVIEIWTRRHFRCDCGNSKFGIGACKLFSSKDPENEENVYNKNYKGAYCICNRPYPDPDSTEDMGEMLQCCVCEDWFHEAHLGLAPTTEEVPRDEEGEPIFDELICQGCAASLEFLLKYTSLMVPTNKSTSSCKDEKLAEAEQAAIFPNTNGTVIGIEEKPTGHDAAQSAAQSFVNKPTTETHALQFERLDIWKQNNPNLNNNVAVDAKGASESRPESLSLCKISSIEVSGSVLNGGVSNLSSCTELQNRISGVWTAKALFLTKNWRSQLCRCDACIALYAEKGVSFLLDSNDTITKYEEIAEQKRKEKLDASGGGRDLSFLNDLSHVGKIEFLNGLNDMTSELSAFFASRESGKAITSAEIYEVFENLKKKRARLE